MSEVSLSPDRTTDHRVRPDGVAAAWRAEGHRGAAGRCRLGAAAEDRRRVAQGPGEGAPLATPAGAGQVRTLADLAAAERISRGYVAASSGSPPRARHRRAHPRWAANGWPRRSSCSRSQSSGERAADQRFLLSRAAFANPRASGPGGRRALARSWRSEQRPEARRCTSMAIAAYVSAGRQPGRRRRE